MRFSKLYFVVVCVICWGIPSSAFGVEAQLLTKLKELFAEAEAAKGATKFSVGAVNLDTGEVLFALNADEVMIPASVAKLVSTYAALKTLGSGYRFPTELFVGPAVAAKADLFTAPPSPREQLDTGELNLYVRGYGDPTLDSGKLSDLAEAVVQHGLTRIADLVIDDSLFVDPPPPSGQNPYEAGVSAVAVNNNAYAIYVSPGKSGEPAIVSLTPGIPFALTNRVTTVRGKSESLQVVQNPQSGARDARTQSPDGAQQFAQRVSVTVQGSIGADSPPVVFYQAVPNPLVNFGSLFAYYLRRAGASVTGSIRRGETPQDAKALETIESDDLALIVRTLNHSSSNFIAAQLLFALGQDSSGYFRRPQGLRRIAEFAGEVGMDPNAMLLVDASGLDRGNRLSVQQLIKLLSAAYKDPAVGPDFVASLGRFGQSGTLKNRTLLPPATLTAIAAKGIRGEELRKIKERAAAVWAKTGTLDGVSSLAGYLVTKANEHVAFALIANGDRPKEELVGIEDRFVKILSGLPE